MQQDLSLKQGWKSFWKIKCSHFWTWTPVSGNRNTKGSSFLPELTQREEELMYLSCVTCEVSKWITSASVNRLLRLITPTEIIAQNLFLFLFSLSLTLQWFHGVKGTIFWISTSRSIVKTLGQIVSHIFTGASRLIRKRRTFLLNSVICEWSR